jgi:hypothetical protein
MSTPAASPTRSIFNTHDQLVVALRAGHKAPFAIGKSSGPLSSSMNGWKVYHPALKTDPKAAWYDYGQKTFRLFGRSETDTAERKAAALFEAQQWVAQTYGYTGEWKRNRMGDYVPADIQKQWPIPKRQ